MDEKTAKAVKALGINAKNEDDARKQILDILKKNEIEGMEDEDLSTLIDIAEAFVGDEDAKSSEEDENDNLAKEVDEEESDDSDDDEDGDADDNEGDELEGMDRTELKAYIKENELDVKVKKSWSDDEIREAIRAAEAEADGDDEQEETEPEPESEPEPKKKASKKDEKKASKKEAKEEQQDEVEKPEKKTSKKDAKTDKKAEKSGEKEGGRKKTKIDPKRNEKDRELFECFKELFPEDGFNYNWVEGGVTIKHRGENSERGIVCMKPFYRKEDGVVGNMYIAALTKNTDILDKNDIEYGFHWNDAPEMKGVTIEEAYDILEKVQDVILEKVQKIDKKLGDNKAKMEKNLEKTAKKEDKKADKKAVSEKKETEKASEKKADKKADKKKAKK